MNNLALEKNTNTFSGINYLRVDESLSRTKYMQVVDLIKSDIECGVFGIGEQIPSISETSAEFYIAKVTVEKAYKILKQKGILSSVKGKGYYVTSAGKLCSKRGLLFLSYFGEEEKVFYKALIANLPPNSEVDILLYNDDSDQLERNILASTNRFDYFVLQPHLGKISENLIKALNTIPLNKLIFLDQVLKPIKKQYSAVLNENNDGMKAALHELGSFNTSLKNLHLIFPDKEYLEEIKQGVFSFCMDRNLNYRVSCEIDEEKVQKGTIYFVKEDDQLVALLKCAQKKNLVVGKDIALICYNDSSVKEILGGGMTVITPNYNLMGVQVAEMVKSSVSRVNTNPYKVIRRNSI